MLLAKRILRSVLYFLMRSEKLKKIFTIIAEKLGVLSSIKRFIIWVAQNAAKDKKIAYLDLNKSARLIYKKIKEREAHF